GAKLTGPERISRPDRVAEAVVDGELVGGAGGDNLKRPARGQSGDGDARPDAVTARGTPLEAAVGAVQSHDVIVAPDHVRQAVAVDICHGGGGIQDRINRRPRKAPNVLP